MICGAPVGAAGILPPVVADNAVAGPEPRFSEVGTRDSGGAFASTPAPPTFLSALLGMPIKPPGGKGDPTGGCDACRGVCGGTGSPGSPPIIEGVGDPVSIGVGVGIADEPWTPGVAVAIGLMFVLMLRAAEFNAGVGGTLPLWALMSPMLGCLAIPPGSPLTPIGPGPGMPFMAVIPISEPCCDLEIAGGPIIPFAPGMFVMFPGGTPAPPIRIFAI
jgi:hypothetical protein